MTFLPEKVLAAFKEKAGFDFNEHVQFACYVGSQSHNTYVPKTTPDSFDDIDIFAVLVPPARRVVGFDPWKQTEHIMVDEWDLTAHSMEKFLKLLLKGNPTVLSALWVRPEERLFCSRLFESMIIRGRDKFSTKESVHAFLGYANEQLHKMDSHENAYQGYMGAKRKALVDKFGYDCYEEASTEFLTDRGWKKFDDVTDSMFLATVEVSSGQMEFQAPVSKTDKMYSGKLFTLEPYSSRAVVTANHNLLVSPMHRNPKNHFSQEYLPEKAEWQLISPEGILAGRRSHYHIRRAPCPREEEIDIPDSYLILAGLFLSDGTLGFRGNGSLKDLRLTQTKPGRFNRMADDLMLVYPFRKYIYEKETIWSAHGDIAQETYADFGHSKNKHLPAWCFRLSARQAAILWDALLAGDGTIKEANDVLYTTSAQLAGDVQAALVLSGYPATVYGPYVSETSFGVSSMYHVVRSNTSGTFHGLNFGRRLEAEEVPQSPKSGHPVKVRDVLEARVVCFEVPNSTLITRNSGKVAIHGNCKNAAHLIRLLTMCVEFLSTGILKVYRDEDADMFRSIKKGEWPIEKVEDVAQGLFKKAREAYEISKLPPGPDVKFAEESLLEFYRCVWLMRSV